MNNTNNNRFMRNLLLAALIMTGFGPAFSQTNPNAKQEAPLVYPTVLASDLKVEHVMNVGLQAVRITQNPVTGDLWYNTFDGDVYRIKNLTSKKISAEKVFSAQDHAITRLQGMAFDGNTLFLGGNISVNDG